MCSFNISFPVFLQVRFCRIPLPLFPLVSFPLTLLLYLFLALAINYIFNLVTVWPLPALLMLTPPTGLFPSCIPLPYYASFLPLPLPFLFSPEPRNETADAPAAEAAQGVSAGNGCVWLSGCLGRRKRMERSGG